MGVGLQANRSRAAGDPQAWKKTIGTRPVSARFSLLPDPQPRWDRIGLSAGGQLAVLVFLLIIPLIFPQQMKTALHYDIVEIMQPVTEIPVAPEPPPPPKIKPKVDPPKPEVPEPVKLNPKQPHVFMNEKVMQPKVQTVEAKPVELNPVLDQVKLDMDTKGPKRPKDDVKVGLMSSGSAATPTIKTPVDVSKVQTGGFGDPNGVPGKGDPNKATNVNRAGLPTLPGGPGYGNGTGGDKGIRGTVASTGFGNDTAIPPPTAKHGNVQSSGFGDQAVAEAPKKKAASTESATTPVDILEKPHPEYTAEGRSLKIEGDVVIDMVFLANGSVQVNRVISGLGHGLDEAAMRAAQQIKFKPAKRDGQAVDFPARVRIEFRLAY